jgi:hypothetical protein
MRMRLAFTPMIPLAITLAIAPTIDALGRTQSAFAAAPQETAAQAQAPAAPQDSNASALRQAPATCAAGGQILAGRGCCSHHKGQCGCQNGRVACCDGSLSPSCRCEADGRFEKR